MGTNGKKILSGPKRLTHFLGPNGRILYKIILLNFLALKEKHVLEFLERAHFEQYSMQTSMHILNWKGQNTQQ